MEPIISISQMMEIIDDENKVHTFSTEQLFEILHTLQHEDLTIYGKSQLATLFGITMPRVSKLDMGKIVRLEKAIINELRNKGEDPPMKKFS